LQHGKKHASWLCSLSVLSWLSSSWEWWISPRLWGSISLRTRSSASSRARPRGAPPLLLEARFMPTRLAVGSSPHARCHFRSGNLVVWTGAIANGLVVQW
jgi:hypothetical protein